MRTRPPKHNWEALYEEWSASGVSPGIFLKGKGFDPSSGNVCAKIKIWNQRGPSPTAKINTVTSKKYLTKDEVHEAYMEVSSLCGKEFILKQINSMRSEIIEAVKEPGHVGMTAADMWNAFLIWRRDQGAFDYLTAEKLRLHLTAILEQNLESRFIREKGQKKEIHTSKLTGAELARLADVALKIQHIQRLALGLSTENLGFEVATKGNESHIEQKKGEDGLPIFVVEMSRGGKFQRVRPRLVEKDAVVD